MRKELSQHTMSARSRTGAGGQERYRKPCARDLSNKPLHSRTRTRSFGLSHGLCSMSCKICSVSRRIASMFQFSRIVRDRLPFVSMLSRVSPHFRFDSSPWRPRCSHHRRCTATLSSLARHTNSLACLSVCLIYKHTQIPGVNLHAVVVQQRRAARRLLCNCQDTSILTSQWPSCCRVSSLLGISVFFFLLPVQHAHAVFARIGVHESQNPQFLTAPITKDRRQLQLFQRPALHHRTASYVCSRSRHICSISFSLYVPTERDKYVWLVQSRRLPEKWTRTRKAGSRGSATPDPVS